MTSCLAPYEPTFVPKPIADDVWIVDGGGVTMKMGPLRVPFTTRMTIVRLPDGGLWLHSPIARTEALACAVADLGPVAWLVSPNRLHTTWMAEWHRAHPTARRAGCARRPAWDGTPIEVEDELDGAGPLPFDTVFDRGVAHGDVFDEAVFFHRPSRTLILTDLIEAFELDRVTCGWVRLLLRLAGPVDPKGTAPFDMRLSFRRHRTELAALVERMIAWAPQRVVLSHGRWYATDAERELRRAFAWVIPHAEAIE
jgi:hypothetical protein